jgi:Methyltransferase domain
MMLRFEQLPLPDHRGTFYQDALRRLHATLRPRSYFEIGTLNGATLVLAECPSVAVDPAFALRGNLPGRIPELHLLQMESDTFFARHDPATILGRPIDLAFLDGLHLFEALLRDFINTERAMHRSGVIVLHDCVPLDMAMARRDRSDKALGDSSIHPGWWAGDVWKLLPILMTMRPDLVLLALDAHPTGLIIVGNLNPDSTVLRDHEAQLVDAYKQPEEPEKLYLRSLQRLTWVQASDIGPVVSAMSQTPERIAA